MASAVDSCVCAGITPMVCIVEDAAISAFAPPPPLVAPLMPRFSSDRATLPPPSFWNILSWLHASYQKSLQGLPT